MVGKINKDFLNNYRFSDKPTAWILEAKNFKYSAEILFGHSTTQPRTSPFIPMHNASSGMMRIKVVCYLFSVLIELFLKGIYSATRTSDDQESIESFGHNVVRLADKLIAKGILNKNGLNKNILNVAHVILEWSGRYHKPTKKKMDEVIRVFFEEVPNEPALLKPKYKTDIKTAKELEAQANAFDEITPVNPTSIDHLIFLPF